MMRNIALAAPAMDEAEVSLSSLKAGERQAWERCYQEWYPKVYSYAYRRTGDREAAADLAAEVFLRMVRELDRYDPRRLSFAAWVFCLAHDRTVDYLRRKGRRPAVSLTTLGERGPLQEDAAEAMAEREALERALRSLTEEQQAVLLLRFYVGLSSEETGKALGKETGAVRALQFRALRHLRQLLAVEEKRPQAGEART